MRFVHVFLFLEIISSICTRPIVAQQCSAAKIVECVAAAAGCGTVCVCDFPACECCIGCLACVTATVANCCECLFPGWSECSSDRENNTTIAPVPPTNSNVAA